MQIIPVLDLMHGQVVHGVGGRRNEYRPIVSRLTSSTDPLAVARAFRAHFGFDELYLADLDAIMGQTPAVAVYQTLQREGFILWVDAGLREMEDARNLHEAGVAAIVAGLETIAGPETLEHLCREYGSDRIVFSLDFKAGLTLGRTSAWSSNDPAAIVRVAIATGIKRLLVLDLAHVGRGSGTGTEELCGRLAGAHPQARIAAGGGIRNMEDVRRMQDLGVETVLIASALHDGRITK